MSASASTPRGFASSRTRRPGHTDINRRRPMLKRMTWLAPLPATVLGGAAPAAAQGAITVYSAGPAELINKLAKDFTAQTGIAVNVFQGTTGQVMARIEAEAANPVVDVLI